MKPSCVSEIVSVVNGECICWWLPGAGGSGPGDGDSTSEAAEIQARNDDGTVFLKAAKNPAHGDLCFGGVNRRNLFSLSFFFNDYYLM